MCTARQKDMFIVADSGTGWKRRYSSGAVWFIQLSSFVFFPLGFAFHFNKNYPMERDRMIAVIPNRDSPLRSFNSRSITLREMAIMATAMTFCEWSIDWDS
jgi:hypothetical protein